MCVLKPRTTNKTNPVSPDPITQPQLLAQETTSGLTANQAPPTTPHPDLETDLASTSTEPETHLDLTEPEPHSATPESTAHS